MYMVHARATDSTICRERMTTARVSLCRDGFPGHWADWPGGGEVGRAICSA